MIKSTDLKLYLVTDRRWLHKPLEETVTEAVLNGVTMIQVREKDLNTDEFINVAKPILAIAREHNVPMVVNDNVYIAKKIDADGVHLGQSDMDITEARELLGKDKIIGLSANTIEKAVEAEKLGADYIGVGSVFPTGSKSNATYIGIKTLKEIANAVSIPVVAIGGITIDNINELEDSNIDGVAVISALIKPKDTAIATKNLITELDKIGL